MADNRLPKFSKQRPIVDATGSPQKEFRLFLDAIERGAYLVGDGSPEAVVEAPLYTVYKNISGATGSISYIKLLSDIGGDKKKGWTLE